MSQSIFIFNPETDYALALGRSHYNPPAKIVTLRKQMQLTPAYIASPGDIVVVSEDFNPSSYPDQRAVARLQSSAIPTATLSEIAPLLRTASPEQVHIIPWGWNHSLHSMLEALAVNPALLKTPEEIDVIRDLSHRRTTIPFQLYLQDKLPSLSVAIAEEFSDADDAVAFAEKGGKVYFKAPWSSSGRGILYYEAANALNNPAAPRKLREWLNGFIRKQGSVMGERAFNRVADFATEWWIEDGRAEFMGLSLFNTSADGRYSGNRQLSQAKILSHLQALSPQFTPEVIEAQKAALEEIIAPKYSGPAGIDMLIDADGTVNPCVEINLRLTMGMIALGKPLPEKL